MKAIPGIAFLVLGTTMSVSSADVLRVEDVSSDFRLYITAWQGEIDIQPATDDAVSVDVNCPEAEDPTARVNELGLRVVSNDQVVPELRKSDDRVTFTAPRDAGECRIGVSAPASVWTQVRINETGRITVSNWRAMVAAWSAGGDVLLRDQRGPFSVTAMNGDATIDYRGSGLQSDSAATAANGVLSLTLADETPMTLRTQARWGEVATDLDAEFAREQIDSATWSVASIAGGGPVVTLRNLNSDIYITRGE